MATSSRYNPRPAPRRPAPLLLALGLVLPGPLPATEPASQPSPCRELPARLASRLDALEDFTYDYDDPAYYDLLAFVKSTASPPGFVCPPLVVDDWADLAARPADFRGRPLTLEGVVARNKDPYVHATHPELGPVWQVELTRPDQALTCTVIFTEPADDLPLGAAIRLTGYFVKINRFPTRSGQPGLSALIVTPGPTLVSRSAPAAGHRDGPDWRWLLAASLSALLVLLLIRRYPRGGQTRAAELHATRPAPLDLSEDLARWAAEEAEPQDGEPTEP